MRNPAFPPEEIERQRSQRLGQLAQQRDNPVTLAQQTAALALYGAKHPFGYLEVGTRAAITATTRDDMLAFWKQHYVPNNTALIVAGDLTMAELRRLGQDVFGDWQRGSAVARMAVRPNTTDARVVIVDRPGSPQTQIRVVSLAVPRDSPDYDALMVMNHELGAVFSSRINMNLREAHGYTYGTYSGFSFRRTGGSFAISGSIRVDVTAPAVAEIFNEIRRIRDAAMPDGELRRARTAIVQSLPATFETSGATVASLANTFVYNLGFDYHRRYGPRVAAITAQQTREVALRHLVPERFIVVAIGDRAKIEPALKALALGPIEIRDRDAAIISQ
jgi:zinc protease